MIGVAIDDFGATAYLAVAVVLALAAVGYVLAPSAPPADAAVVGLFLL